MLRHDRPNPFAERLQARDGGADDECHELHGGPVDIALVPCAVYRVTDLPPQLVEPDYTDDAAERTNAEEYAGDNFLAYGEIESGERWNRDRTNGNVREYGQ